MDDAGMAEVYEQYPLCGGVCECTICEPPKPTPEQVAVAIMESESMMWLMVGANHPDAHIGNLRKGWDMYKAAGGSTYGHQRNG